MMVLIIICIYFAAIKKMLKRIPIFKKTKMLCSYYAKLVNCKMDISFEIFFYLTLRMLNISKYICFERISLPRKLYFLYTTEVSVSVECRIIMVLTNSQTGLSLLGTNMLKVTNEEICKGPVEFAARVFIDTYQNQNRQNKLFSDVTISICNFFE